MSQAHGRTNRVLQLKDTRFYAMVDNNAFGNKLWDLILIKKELCDNLLNLDHVDYITPTAAGMTRREALKLFADGSGKSRADPVIVNHGDDDGVEMGEGPF